MYDVIADGFFINQAIIVTAYMVFPSNGQYYCDVTGGATGACSELDFMELTNKSCFTMTAHPNNQNQNQIIEPWPFDRNNSKFDFLLTLTKVKVNGKYLAKFNLTITDKQTQKSTTKTFQEDSTSSQTIYHTSTKNPGVLVFSIWNGGNQYLAPVKQWWPGSQTGSGWEQPPTCCKENQCLNSDKNSINSYKEFTEPQDYSYVKITDVKYAGAPPGTVVPIAAPERGVQAGA